MNIYKLSACISCAMIAYYGEREAQTNGYTEEEISACTNGLARLGIVGGVAASDVQNEADFSRDTCEICLSPLAGSRLAVTFTTFEPLSPAEVLRRT